MGNKMSTIEELIETVRKSNPYPEKVFTEPTEEQWKVLQEIIRDAGLVQDRFSGSLARIVWINCCDTFIKTMNEILHFHVNRYYSTTIDYNTRDILAKKELKTKKDARIAIKALQKIEEELEE